MDSETKEFFRIESKNNGNGQCFECLQLEPNWASVTLGIFICVQCAGIHRSLGSHLSFVRSTLMDTWKPHHLASITMGGNNKLRSYLELNLGPDYQRLPLEKRYASSCAEAYRHNLAILSGAKEGTPVTFQTSSKPAPSVWDDELWD